MKKRHELVVVPLDQRRYVWGADEQWEPLLDDVATLLQHQDSASAWLYLHFFGPIVLSPSLART
jgi:hypothetical protein